MSYSAGVDTGDNNGKRALSFTDFLFSSMIASANLSDLERENSHFEISEAVISVIEVVKNHLQQAKSLRDEHVLRNNTSASNSNENIADFNMDYSEKLSPALSNEDVTKLGQISAEELALSLWGRFSKEHAINESELTSLFNDKSLFPVRLQKPITIAYDRLAMSNYLLDVFEAAKFQTQIVLQNQKCAGCTTTATGPRDSSKFRFCNYLGKYFCTYWCHSGQLSLIPGRVSQKLDIKKYPVSKIAFQYLEQIYAEPVLKVFEFKSNVVKKFSPFSTTEQLRSQLFYLKDYILNCRLAQNSKKSLLSLPKYLYCNLEMYSVRDFVLIKHNILISKLKIVFEVCDRHVLKCVLCNAKAFLCEVCKRDDILFPWQFEKVSRCSFCKACYHLNCWDSGSDYCRKCVRKKICARVGDDTNSLTYS